MTRIFALNHETASCALLLVTIVCAIGCVGGFAVPNAINSGAVLPLSQAIFNNLRLLALFAIQHSAMARTSIERWWTQFIPASIGRSTCALFF